MITVIKQRKWLLSGTFTISNDHFWSFVSGHEAHVLRVSCFAYQLDASRQIQQINHSYMRDFVEVDYRTLHEGSFTYKGHEWNPVDNGQAKGFIYNFPASAFPVQKLGTDINVVGSPDRVFIQPILLGGSAPNDLSWSESAKYGGFTMKREAAVWFFSRSPFTYVVNVSMTSGYTGNNEDRRYVFQDGNFYPKDKLTMNFSALLLCPHPTLPNRYWGVTVGLGSTTYTGYDSLDRLRQQCAFFVSQDAFDRAAMPNYGLGNWPGTLRQYDGTTGDVSFTLPSYDAVMPDLIFKKVNWHDLAGRAYSTARFSDINGIAGVEDVLSFGASATSFIETLGHIPKGRAKAFAQAYLSVHFGFKLFFMDLFELRDTLAKQALKRSSLSKVQASDHWLVGNTHYAARYQVFYDQFAGVQSLLDQALQISDFQLSLENWWDMVPYSFVVDWFIGIGDVLAKIDDYANMTQNHETICCGRSLKGWEALTPERIHLPGGFWCSSLELSRFIRTYQHELILPSLTPSVTINPFNHSVEGAALIISRR